MKIVAVMTILAFLLGGCARELNTKDNVTYPPFGLFNTAYESPDVCYSVSAGNVILSIIFVETIIAPVYVFGFALYEPVRLKNGPADDCSFHGKRINPIPWRNP